MEKKIELRSIIKFWEDKKLNLETTLEKIENLSGKKTNEHTLKYYWTTTSLDNLCDSFCAEPMKDLENINDEPVIILIKEIIDNTEKEGIIEQNGVALENKYQKYSGFVSDLIFHSNFNELEILELLKKTTINL